MIVYYHVHALATIESISNYSFCTSKGISSEANQFRVKVGGTREEYDVEHRGQICSPVYV